MQAPLTIPDLMTCYSEACAGHSISSMAGAVSVYYQWLLSFNILSQYSNYRANYHCVTLIYRN
jgi:hypothetical protein